MATKKRKPKCEAGTCICSDELVQRYGVNGSEKEVRPMYGVSETRRHQIQTNMNPYLEFTLGILLGLIILALIYGVSLLAG